VSWHDAIATRNRTLCAQFAGDARGQLSDESDSQPGNTALVFLGMLEACSDTTPLDPNGPAAQDLTRAAERFASPPDQIDVSGDEFTNQQQQEDVLCFRQRMLSWAFEEYLNFERIFPCPPPPPPGTTSSEASISEDSGASTSVTSEDTGTDESTTTSVPDDSTTTSTG
jgi:hypothetical protein